MLTTIPTQGELSYHEGDTAPALRITLVSGDQPIDLIGATGFSFILYPRGSEGNVPKGSVPMTVDGDTADGTVVAIPTPDLFDHAGEFSAVVEVEWGTFIETMPDAGYIDVTVHPKGG